MSTPTSRVGSADGSLRQFLATAPWALTLAWSHHSFILSALILTTIALGLFPAAFALERFS